MNPNSTISESDDAGAISCELAVDRYVVDVLGLKPVAASQRQILIVNRITPRLGNWQETGKPPTEGADILLEGHPSPNSDPALKSAIIYFHDANLRPPSYEPASGQIRLFRTPSSLNTYLEQLANPKEAYCWIGTWSSIVYADVHTHISVP
jgi:hypothetical protein